MAELREYKIKIEHEHRHEGLSTGWVLIVCFVLCMIMLLAHEGGQPSLYEAIIHSLMR